MKLGQLVSDADPAFADRTVTGFAIDHRKIAPGTVFGAFEGASFNGEDFIDAAIAGPVDLDHVDDPIPDLRPLRGRVARGVLPLRLQRQCQQRRLEIGGKADAEEVIKGLEEQTRANPAKVRRLEAKVARQSGRLLHVGQFLLQLNVFLLQPNKLAALALVPLALGPDLCVQPLHHLQPLLSLLQPLHLTFPHPPHAIPPALLLQLL